MSIQKFRFLVENDQIPLLESSLLMVKNIVDPTLEINTWVSEMDDLAKAAAESIDQYAETQNQMHALTNWLFNPQSSGAGFTGNRKQYGDPRNSYLHEVLKRGLGIPISLSVVCIEVGKRLSLNFEGIGLPGHFVVGGYINQTSPPLLFDPFNSGKHLTQDECAKLVAHTTGYFGTFQEEWLQPTSTKMILVRMLNNLRVAFMRQEHWHESIEVIRHLRILQPAVPTLERDEGLIHYHVKNFPEASMLLESYLSQSPEADDVELIKTTIGGDLDAWAKLN